MGIIKPVAGLLVLLTVLTSCITTTYLEPEDGIDQVAFGIIELDAEGFGSYGGASVNGNHKSSIELTFENLDTGEEIKVRSLRPAGLFIVPLENGASYRLTKGLFKEHGDDGAWANVWIDRTMATRFESNDSGVVNLGRLHWVANADAALYEITYDDEPGFDIVKTAVVNKYPESEWLLRSWSNTEIVRVE